MYKRRGQRLGETNVDGRSHAQNNNTRSAQSQMAAGKRWIVWHCTRLTPLRRQLCKSIVIDMCGVSGFRTETSRCGSISAKLLRSWRSSMHVGSSEVPFWLLSQVLVGQTVMILIVSLVIVFLIVATTRPLLQVKICFFLLNKNSIFVSPRNFLICM